MAQIPEVTPYKKKKTTIDYQYCIICQVEDSNLQITKNISEDSLKTLIGRCREREKYKDNRVFEFTDRIEGITAKQILENKGFYHRNCYKIFSNKNEVSRAQQRFDNLKGELSPESVLKRKVGRPSLKISSPIFEPEEPMVRRSQTVVYDKNLCIICQKNGGNLHKVLTMQMGANMLTVSEKIADKNFHRRLNTIPAASDAPANDVMYHNPCWVKVKREAHNSCEVVQEHDYIKALSDVEIIHFVKKELTDPRGKVLDMNLINETYKNILSTNGKPIEHITINNKKYLKDLILNSIDEVSFIKNKNPSKAEQLVSTQTQSEVIDSSIKEFTTDHMEKIWTSAKIVRSELLNREKWQFTGTFNDFLLPPLLSTLIKWIIVGPFESSNEAKTRGVDRLVSMVSQIIIQNVKSPRQVYNESSKREMNTVVETPLNIGLGMFMHQQTRSKVLVEMLSDLNLSVSYEKVIKIQHDIAGTVKTKIDENNIYFPPGLSSEKFLYFAIDNADLKVDTPDGKNQLHGTIIVAYQSQEGEKCQQSNLVINRKQCKNVQNIRDPLYKVTYCLEPSRKNLNYQSYLPLYSHTVIELHTNEDIVWGILKSFSGSSANMIPTWAAFNSILSDKTSVTNISTLPLIAGSPTDWSNLSTGLKVTKDLTAFVGKNEKAIVSLDLQLYSKCIQLQQKDEIDENYIFRMGELHVVFTALKVLGKIIDGSGLDLSLEEAGIYGSTTLSQIKEGKHLYRTLEAHFILYLALHKQYIAKLLEKHPDVNNYLQETVATLTTTKSNNAQDFDTKLACNKIKEVLLETKFDTIQSLFDTTLKNQAKFLRNYMKVFEMLLLFIRASRQQNWKLHLTSLHNLAKFFFSYDMLNYARLTPVYLSQMYALEQSNETTWNFFVNGNFSVNKSTTPFTALGADHALEQVNKAIKTHGGIKGIANNQRALDQYFIIAPEVSNIIEKFRLFFGIVEITEQDEHYQLKGGKNKRITESVSKLISVFENHNTNFEDSENVYNTITKKILPQQFSQRFLQHEEIGEKRLMEFIENRLEGDVSIWAPLKKTKLPTFALNIKSQEVHIHSAVVTVKEERMLMSRLIIAARTRPEIDLAKYLGDFEFSVVPQSLFSADGNLIKTTDKSVIVQDMEKQFPHINDVSFSKDSDSAIIFDAMAVVNKINIQKCKLKTCSDFADKFIEIITQQGNMFDEIYVIFDRYDKKSLKSATREYRTSGVHIQYKIDDDTNIENISTTKFLSHIITKKDLTKYLSSKLSEALSRARRQYVIVHNNVAESNMSSFPEELKTHTHEEADTLIILHAINIAKKNPFMQLYISCSDTDVLLLLLNFYPSICNNTVFRTNTRDIDIGSIYNALGEDKCKAILGFHSFTGCDQTGKFNRFSKLSCWKTFLISKSDVLESFKKLGEENVDLSASSDITKGLSNFLLDLYYHKRPNHINTLQALRWFLFSKFQFESKKLPPTPSALQFVIFRSHFITNIWKNSNLPSPTPLNPEEYGWKYDQNENMYEAVMTNQLPAPETIVELSLCKCKSGCNTLRCNCKKSSLVCTEMCMCDQCTNHVNHKIYDSETEDE